MLSRYRAFPGYEEVRDIKMFVGKGTSSGQLKDIRIDNCPVIICKGEELWVSVYFYCYSTIPTNIFLFVSVLS